MPPFVRPRDVDAPLTRDELDLYLALHARVTRASQLPAPDLAEEPA